MRCPRCGNEDPSWFWQGSRGWYCRRCIQFSRQLLEEEQTESNLMAQRDECDPELRLDYPLTPAQKRVSDQLCEKIQTQDVLIYAVCGSGKTEIVMDCLRQTLKKGQRAAVAIARRQVVLELAQRFSAAFPHLVVTPVCQGYTAKTDGDLIVCTTHQLYRYIGAFDVLVLDEPDAFPFKGDPVLHGIAAASCRGHTVYTTATPDAHLQRRVRENTLTMLTLFSRPHGHPLPVPKIRVGPRWLLWLWLAAWLRKKEKEGKQALIFVPTTAMSRRLARVFSVCYRVADISSRSVDKDEIIHRFRSGQTQFCFATTILERGITIEGIDVAVLEADHSVFDEASLVQMAGRIGRSFRCPDGEGLFLCRRRSTAAENCIRSLRQANAAG